MTTMTEFVGSRLTHGSFQQMNTELHALMAEKEALVMANQGKTQAPKK